MITLKKKSGYQISQNSLSFSSVSIFHFFFNNNNMGTTASRERSIHYKNRRKLPSLKSQKSKDIDLNASTLSKSPSTDTTTQINLPDHQVVLSDHVSPMSSLSAVISIPMRRSSWRRSVNTTTTRNTNDNTSMTSSYFEEDDDQDDNTSPRTSVGSEDNNSALPKIEHAEKKKKKKSSPASFSSIKSNYKKEGNDIVLESKNNNGGSTCSSSTEEPIKRTPRPFWSYNNGDEREYDR
jgi:hypothetical protein